MIIRSGNFSLFLLHFFYLHFVLLAESKPLICKFNHSTVHARVAVIFFFLILGKFFDLKNLYRGKSMSKE